MVGFPARQRLRLKHLPGVEVQPNEDTLHLQQREERQQQLARPLLVQTGKHPALPARRVRG